MENNILSFFGLNVQGKLASIIVREVDDYYFITLLNDSGKIIQRIKSSLGEANKVIQEYLKNTFVTPPKTEGALSKEEIDKLGGKEK